MFLSKSRLWLTGIRYRFILDNLYKLFSLKLRRIYFDKYKDKDSSFIIELCNVITKKLFNEKYSKEEVTSYDENADTIEKEILTINELQELKDILSEYDYLSSEQRPIEEESITRIKYRIDRRLQNEIRENVLTAIKIDPSPQDISSFFQLMVPIFIITGFCYNYYYLGYFNIDVSRYFTIGDYLSTSVEKIYISIISVVMAVIGIYLYSYHSGYVVDMIRDYAGIVRPRIRKFLWLLFGIWFIVFTVSYSYLSEHTILYIILGMIMGSEFYFNIPVERIFRKAFFIDLCFMILVYFSALMILTVKIDINRVESSKLGNDKTYIITYDKEVKYNDKAWILLAGNSGFMFFYDKQNHKSYVIPKGLVKSIEIDNRQSFETVQQPKFEP